MDRSVVFKPDSTLSTICSSVNIESGFLPLLRGFKSLFTQERTSIPVKDGKIHFVPTTKISCFGMLLH